MTDDGRDEATDPSGQEAPGGDPAPSGTGADAAPFGDSGDILGRLRARLDAVGLGPSGLDVRPPLDPQGRTLAAGLILLYPRRDPAAGTAAPHLVLTRRTATLRRHSGQISLPGGRHDGADGSLLRTALRETHEELGVAPEGLAIWGRLEPEWIVVTHYLLAPYIAYAPRRPEFRPAPAEVAEVIEVPLATLLDPATLAEETWELAGVPRQVHFYRYGEHKIWGATARVLSKLAALLAPVGGPGTGAAARIQPGLVLPERTRPLDT
ncbi:MAG: CoA pyrophosphatase [Chloroflexota bacterium]|nr:CoA pyrophosphatase [Chloroflexota bacterium]